MFLEKGNYNLKGKRNCVVYIFQILIMNISIVKSLLTSTNYTTAYINLNYGLWGIALKQLIYKQTDIFIFMAGIFLYNF